MTRVFDEDLTAGFGTRAIHAGQRPDPLAGAIMTPVYLTSTYVQDGLGENKGYEYARGKNPTREALERNVAALENGRHGFAFASGMGCLDSIMKLFRAGDHIVCGENVYGGTFRLFDKILQHFGLSFTFVDTRDPQRIADAMTPATRAVLVETPTNPLMRLTDIAAAAEIAHRARRAAHRRQHLRVAVLPAPARARRRHRVPLDDEVPQRPQRHDRRLRRRARRRLRRAPPVHPQRGRRGRRARSTPGSRCAARRRCTCACDSTISTAARSRAGSSNRLAPRTCSTSGLPTHPQHELARRQMSGFGGMISVELGTRERAAHVLEHVSRLLARRVAGRRRVADQPAGGDDARLGAARAPRRPRHHRRPRPPLVRRGGRRAICWRISSRRSRGCLV